MNRLTPLLFSIFLGLGLGFAVYLTVESKALSYLSTRSEACANCHVMLSSYNTWKLSSHSRVAQCADCHIPQENIVRKYAAKAMDGGRHAYVFTTRTYDTIIRTTESARSTIQHNCIRCHQGMLLPTPGRGADLLATHSIDRPCWSCHREIPHGRANSIATYVGIEQSSENKAAFIGKQETK